MRRPTKHKHSIRLQGYDYSQSGAYFVTICTKDRECPFGNTADSKICLTEGGKIVEDCWREIPKHYPMVALDEFIVMPNHVHGIVVIDKPDVRIPTVGVQDFEPLQSHEQLQNQFQHIIPASLGSIVRGFKIGVTKWFRQNTDVYTVWQRNYFERVTRNENELKRIREYILNNPIKWDEDEENPEYAKRTKT